MLFLIKSLLCCDRVLIFVGFASQQWRLLSKSLIRLFNKLVEHFEESVQFKKNLL